jgi:hypothetical protein
MTNEDKALISDMNERLKRLEEIYFSKGQEIKQPIDTTEGEQEQDKEWKVGEWVKDEMGNCGLVIEIIKNGDLRVDNQSPYGGLITIGTIYVYQPTTEEIQAHLVAIAEKKYPVGAKYKRMGSLEIVGEIKTKDFIYLPEKNALTEKTGYIVWKDGKWAEIVAPIETEQRWQPSYGVKYWYIGSNDGQFFVADFHWGNDDVDFVNHDTGNCFKTEQAAQKAAEAIKQYLSTNKF